MLPSNETRKQTKNGNSLLYSSALSLKQTTQRGCRVSFSEAAQNSSVCIPVQPTALAGVGLHDDLHMFLSTLIIQWFWTVILPVYCKMQSIGLHGQSVFPLTQLSAVVPIGWCFIRRFSWVQFYDVCTRYCMTLSQIHVCCIFLHYNCNLICGNNFICNRLYGTLFLHLWGRDNDQVVNSRIVCTVRNRGRKVS